MDNKLPNGGFPPISYCLEKKKAKVDTKRAFIIDSKKLNISEILKPKKDSFLKDNENQKMKEIIDI